MTRKDINYFSHEFIHQSIEAKALQVGQSLHGRGRKKEERGKRKEKKEEREEREERKEREEREEREEG